MRFRYDDYEPPCSEFESWLDSDARRFTGIDGSFREFYEYWRDDPDSKPGENYFCKLISEGGEKVAVAAFGLWDSKLTVMEVIVAPEKRGIGIGSAVLSELIGSADAICGISFDCAEACIFPDNTASKKAFTKAGFTLGRISSDGDAEYYVLGK